MLGRVQPFVQGHTASAMVDETENTVRGGRGHQSPCWWRKAASQMGGTGGMRVSQSANTEEAATMCQAGGNKTRALCPWWGKQTLNK